MKKQIPKEFIQEALKLGAKRTELNESTRNSNEFFHSFNPKQADFLGVLGEMVANFETMKKGKAFFFNALLDKNPVPEPDLIIKTEDEVFRIDVKATQNEKFYLPVYKLEKAEKIGITHFWIFIFDIKNKVYQHRWFSIDAVKTWEIVEMWNKKNYFKKL